MNDRYIRVYDNILSKELCLYYISLINKGKRNAGKHIGVDGNHTVDSKVKHSEDIALCKEYPDELKRMLEITAGVLDKYDSDVGVKVPVQKTEEFRGRIYRENEGHYKAHIDVASPVTYGRMITIIYYLNTIEEGGELYFPNQDLTVKAVQGRCVMFPPYWLYPHEARPSLKGDRYIMRTFAKGP